MGQVGLRIVVALLYAAAARTASAEWGTYQGDAAHSGHVAGSYNPNNFRTKYSASIRTSAALSDLAIGGGKVFVAQSNYIHAVDASSGVVAWSKSFGSVFSTNPPAYANGVVYLQTCNHSSDTWLHAFNSNTGGYVFKAPFSAQWEDYQSPTIYDGNVYINGGYYGGMYSFNAQGSRNWFGSVPQYDSWTPAVDQNNAYAFTGSGSTSPVTGKLTILNRLTGQTRAVVTDAGYQWNGYDMDASVTLGSMNSAFAINGGRLLKFNTASPSIAWIKTGGYTGQPAVADGTVYLVRNGGITALAEDTGDQRWAWFVSVQSLLSQPIVVTDNMLFACTKDTTYGISLLTHETVWTYPASGRLAISDDTLYIAGNSGVLHSIALVPEPAMAGIIVPSILVLGSRVARRPPRS